MKQSAWKRLVELINSFGPITYTPGITISRKYIMRNMKGFNSVTIDNYRLMLAKLGFLEHQHQGLYLIRVRIPEDLSCGEAWRKCGYHKGRKTNDKNN